MFVFVNLECDSHDVSYLVNVWKFLNQHTMAGNNNNNARYFYGSLKDVGGFIQVTPLPGLGI
jgi:hypothetical protein